MNDNRKTFNWRAVTVWLAHEAGRATRWFFIIGFLLLCFNFWQDIIDPPSYSRTFRTVTDRGHR